MGSLLTRFSAAVLSATLLASCTDVVEPVPVARVPDTEAPDPALVPAGPTRLLAANVELPANPTGTLTDWSGTFLQLHEPILVPAGTWRVDVEVTGFVSMTNANVGTLTYGPTGMREGWDGPGNWNIQRWFGQVSMSFIKNVPARIPWWSAWDTDETEATASGSLIVRGPGRIEMSRADGYLGFYVAGPWDRSSTQRFTLHLTPLQEESGSLTVRCPTVTRGQIGRCAASMTDGSRFTVTHWNFTSPPDPGSTEPITVDLDTDSVGWGGPLVRSGVVTVTALVNGREQKASTPLTVIDRDWSTKEPAYTFRRIENGEGGLILLRAVIEYADDLGRSEWFIRKDRASLQPDFTEDVPGGPNDGLTFFSDSSTVVFYGYYALNTAAMSTGSAFYLAQPQSVNPGASLGVQNLCGRLVVTRHLPEKVDDHERYHGEVYEQVVRQRFPLIMQRLESLVAEDGGTLTEAYERAWSDLDAPARSASIDVHFGGSERGLPHLTNSRGRCGLLNENHELLRPKPQIP